MLIINGLYTKSQKKESNLFLTLFGFEKSIKIFSNKINNDTKNILCMWLNQFKKINRWKGIEFKLYGYFYLITSPVLNAIKAGYWKSSIYKLRSRYVTNYGSNLEIFYISVENAKEFENFFCHKFKNMHIINELYDKNFIEDYKDFVNQNETCTNDFSVHNDNNIGFLDNFKTFTIKNDYFKDINIIKNLDDNTIFFKFDDIEQYITDNTYYSNKFKYIIDKTTHKNILYVSYQEFLRILLMSKSQNTKIFLINTSKTLLTLSNGFVEDFFDITKEEYYENELVIDFNKVIKWFGTRKDHLKAPLVKHFENDYDYQIKKLKIKNNGGNGTHYVENITLTHIVSKNYVY